MEQEYTNKDHKEVKVDEIERVIITDNEGNYYRIKADRFGGIEVMAEDGKISIEPNVSNMLTIKTLS